MSEPREIVEKFIHQACCLFGRHSSRIEEFRSCAKNENISEDAREAYSNQFWDAIRGYRQEHKKLCEQFGFNINNNNFSETSYGTPIVYDKHKVAQIENLSVTKVKVITKHSINEKEHPLVFYLEFKKEQWLLVKLRQIESDNKEASVWCW